MAHYSEHDSSKIYQAADAFRTNCLLRDGSLVFNGVSLWRSDVLESIHKAFVATPDEGDRSFIAKFKDQIGTAGQEVVRLAGELLCLYFLFPSNVGGIRKRQVVNEVLGWSGDDLPETHLVSSAFSHGIGGGGQGYNTRRPFEIAFLIEFAIAWKKQQKQVAADPWRFEEKWMPVRSSANCVTCRRTYRLAHSVGFARRRRVPRLRCRLEKQEDDKFTISYMR